jgi:hypothetical protein
MKGKLILTPVSSPEAGIWVVFKDEEKLRIANLEKSSRYQFCLFDLENHYIDEVHPGSGIALEEFNQIAIEYEKSGESGLWEKIVLPLHLDDWSWALEHLEEEVEFYIMSSGEVRISLEQYEKREEHLEFLTHQAQKPGMGSVKTYTQEQVNQLLFNTAARWFGKGIQAEKNHTIRELRPKRENFIKD